MVVDQVKRGARVLGDRTIKDYVDTCRENGGGVADIRFSRRFGGLGLKTTGWTVSRFVKKIYFYDMFTIS